MKKDYAKKNKRQQRPVTKILIGISVIFALAFLGIGGRVMYKAVFWSKVVARIEAGLIGLKSKPPVVPSFEFYEVSTKTQLAVED